MMCLLSGIIPAGAGRSFRTPNRRPNNGGSSPRVRGEDWGDAGAYVATGIIPAGAGRRCPNYALTRRKRDHPRGCGEKT